MQSRANKTAALIIAVTASFVTPFMASSVNVALPEIARDFSLNAVTLSWIATSYILAAAAFLVPCGKLGDIYGRKKVYLIGITQFCTASILCAISISPTMLIASRVAQGAGAGMIFATNMAIITSVFPPEERGKALGIAVSAVYFGMGIGPFIGGFVTQAFGWRGVFLTVVPLVFFSIYVLTRNLKGDWAEARGTQFDIIGSIIYAGSLVSLMYGLTLTPNPIGVALVAIAILGFWGFVKLELSLNSPVFEMNLLRANKVFSLSSLAALLNYGATFSVTFLLSLYLQNIKGLSPINAGIVLAVQPTIMAILSPLAGRLSDKVEPRVVASTGMVFTAVGLLLLSFLRSHSTFTFILMCLVIMGLGFALFSSPNMNAIMGSVEKRYYGVASGTVGTMRMLGQMTSMGIATLVFALVLGDMRMAPDNHHLFMESLRLCFMVSSALCFAGITASLARGKLRPRT